MDSSNQNTQGGKRGQNKKYQKKQKNQDPKNAQLSSNESPPTYVKKKETNPGQEQLDILNEDTQKSLESLTVEQKFNFLFAGGHQ